MLNVLGSRDRPLLAECLESLVVASASEVRVDRAAGLGKVHLCVAENMSPGADSVRRVSV